MFLYLLCRNQYLSPFQSKGDKFTMQMIFPQKYGGIVFVIGEISVFHSNPLCTLITMQRLLFLYSVHLCVRKKYLKLMC